MKMSFAVVALLVMPMAWSADSAVVPKTPVPQPPAHPAPSAVAGKEASIPSLPLMQEHMKKMQERMANIRQAKDPQEKERLVQENMQEILDHMKMMQTMLGMMGGGSMPPQILEQRLKMLEQRMDMTQRLMDQLRSPPDKIPAEKK